ncbi:MAG: hypothetical protein WC058_10990 [Phycisphaeraceae bacterium]
MTTRTKPFDCVQMKRRGAEHVYEAVKGMTLEEEAAYWRGRTAKLRREQTQLRARRTANPANKK